MANFQSEPSTHDGCAELDVAADEAIAALDGNARDAVKALISLTYQLEDRLAQISYGYLRGRVGIQEVGHVTIR